MAPGPRPAAVAAGHRGTAGAAAAVLRLGGNAFDAAVAAGCAAAVVEPCLTSLAGGGFLTARTAAGEEVVVDFFVAVPGLRAEARHDPGGLVRVPIHFGAAVQDFHVGPASVAVPGVLAGYLHVHERWGRLPLDQVVAPAVELAGRGVVVDEHLARLTSLLAPVFERTVAGRELFFRDDRPLTTGDRFDNPALAEFLNDVGAGSRRGFTQGELGGQVTAADLGRYRVEERDPLRVARGGAELLINPAPSFGGRLVAHALERLAGSPRPFSADEPASVVDLAEALVAMAEHRRSLGPGNSRGTTHISICDGEGNHVAMTTSNGSGSGEFAAGLGVQLNNMMGEEDLHPDGFGAMEPGSRIGSMMAPAVLRSAGRHVVLGSGGSERIRSVITQLVLRLVDSGEEPEPAVLAPRLHWDGASLQAEPGWPEPVLAALGRRWPVNRWDRPDLYFGGAHVVSSDGHAVGDPRRGGAGIVIEP